MEQAHPPKETLRWLYTSYTVSYQRKSSIITPAISHVWEEGDKAGSDLKNACGYVQGRAGVMASESNRGGGWLPNSWLGGYRCDRIQREAMGGREEGRDGGREGEEQWGQILKRKTATTLFVCLCDCVLVQVQERRTRRKRVKRRKKTSDLCGIKIVQIKAWNKQTPCPVHWFVLVWHWWETSWVSQSTTNICFNRSNAKPTHVFYSQFFWECGWNLQKNVAPLKRVKGDSLINNFLKSAAFLFPGSDSEGVSGFKFSHLAPWGAVSRCSSFCCHFALMVA